jgi:hypothetical protein
MADKKLRIPRKLKTETRGTLIRFLRNILHLKKKSLWFQSIPLSKYPKQFAFLNLMPKRRG